MDRVSRKMKDVKKGLKRNIKGQKHCNRDEECLWWIHY